jgi:predicted dehydrogenase
MKKKINWGIIALGKIADKFAADLPLVNNANLYAVASRDKQKSKKFAKKHKAEKAYGSYEELAKDTNVDVVYIASPHAYHYEHTMLCLTHNKHVLCEKPMGMNLDQVTGMIKKAQDNKLFLMEALWTRFNPSYRKCLELIEKGKIGEIKSIQADFGFRVNTGPEDRLLARELGGGALLDIGIYPVFLALSLLGEPDEVFAKSYFGETGADLSTSMLFAYSGKNVVANLSSTFLANTPVEATISGTKGRIKLHRPWHHAPSVELIRKEKSMKFNFSEPGNGYEYEIEEVHHCLRNQLFESGLFSHSNSLQLHTTLDHIRRIVGLNYDKKQ